MIKAHQIGVRAFLYCGKSSRRRHSPKNSRPRYAHAACVYEVRSAEEVANVGVAHLDLNPRRRDEEDENDGDAAEEDGRDRGVIGSSENATRTVGISLQFQTARTQSKLTS